MTVSSAYRLIICFAGSRHGSVTMASALVSEFAARRASFLVGCAAGVDHSFRSALVAFASSTTIHCAFPTRVSAISHTGLSAVCLVRDAPSPASALHRRTVYMVSACTHLVLFPDDPHTGTWGRGSRLAFDTAVMQRKRIFIVTSVPPVARQCINVICASLFGLISGYLVEPVVVEDPHVA